MDIKLKMKDVFPESFVNDHSKSFEVQNCHYIGFGDSYHSDCYQGGAIEEAVLSYDANQDEIAKLNQENQQLTQLLADEREKANARIEELEGEMANMVDRI